MQQQQTDVKSPINKEMLWSVLNDHGLFNGVPNSMYGTVKHSFEQTIDRISSHGSGDSVPSLNHMNRDILREMKRIIGMIGSKTSGPNNRTSAPVLRAEMQTQRTDELAQKTKLMADDFASFANPTPKKTVKFSDDVDKLSPNVLEDRMSAAIAARELELYSMPPPKDVVGEIVDIPMPGSGSSMSNEPIETSFSSNVSIHPQTNELEELREEMRIMKLDIEELKRTQSSQL